MNTSTLVQKLWNYCNALRDDGMSYGDCVEQLTYLLFLKMADERSRPPYNQPSLIPAPYAWPRLLAKDGDELFDHYRHPLEALGNERGTLALIFNKARNKFDSHRFAAMLTLRASNLRWRLSGSGQAAARDRGPDRRRRLVRDGRGREGRRLRGPAGKNAQDTTSGAGRYFAPRALIVGGAGEILRRLSSGGGNLLGRGSGGRLPAAAE